MKRTKFSISHAFFKIALIASLLPNLPAPAQAATSARPVVTREIASQGVGPTEFVSSRVQWLLKELEGSRPYMAPAVPVELSIRANRNEWLERVYELNLVSANEASKLLTDKLIMAKAVVALTGESGLRFHPKSIGLKEFLEKHQLVAKDFSVIRDRARIQSAIQSEFPHGAIVKPTTGINSEGKAAKGFWFKTDKFIDDLLAPGSVVYQPLEFFTPHKSELLDGYVASGEKFMLQENVIMAAGILKPIRVKELKEIRVHTYQDRVVKDASYSRWKELDAQLTDADIAAAADFAQDFLRLLPKSFTARQAWSLDVARMDNGVLRLIEINLNRGLPMQWSGYLPKPYILGAYTRHLEDHYNVEFAGISGFLLRHDLGNYPKYVYKKFVEKSL